MELKDIERSIIKKYRKEIWHNFVKAINDYELLQENDHVAVCISGGKDSFLLAKCMQELQRHSKFPFELEYICMNPGYNEEAKNKILENANKLGIELKMFDSEIFNVVKEMSPEEPCYLCARMRRGYLYNYAKELGCNKIALGHHFDDVIETTLLSMFYNGRINTMLPKLHSTNHPGMELIRPLYLVKEKNIIAWSHYCDLTFIGCACLLKKENSKRIEIKKLIEDLRKQNDIIDGNIFRSTSNVNLNEVVGYQKDNIKYTFLDDYDK
jgi:tRNA(Ile)-lysidine synthase TilS/MesJ